MKIGTKSVLFGAHQFLIHPLFVALGWWKLYGFPLDPRLWIAFFIHDLGYIGKPDIDGIDGSTHPFWAAEIMNFFFGRKWYYFCLYHSRYLAGLEGRPISRLCVADKLAIVLEPWWLYLPRVILTKELDEYMGLMITRYNMEIDDVIIITPSVWFRDVCKYLTDWVDKNKGMAGGSK